jgi:hypothetical protein
VSGENPQSPQPPQDSQQDFQQDSQQDSHQRLTSGVGQFALAIGACLALVGLIMLITPGTQKETIPQVDARSAAEAIRLTAPYESQAPEGLPAGWRATSSRLSGDKGPVAWHLGYLTPSDQYAALEESNERPASTFVARMTNVDPLNPKTLVGTRQIAGAVWNEYYRKDKKQNSLVRELPTVALVVTGTASYDELAVLAGSLKPQPRTAAAP